MMVHSCNEVYYMMVNSISNVPGFYRQYRGEKLGGSFQLDLFLSFCALELRWLISIQSASFQVLETG